MDYSSKDLSIWDVDRFINQTIIAEVLKEKYGNSFYYTHKITKKELKYLVKAFAKYYKEADFEKKVFAGYARVLIARANAIKSEITEKCREEFNSYIFKNNLLAEYLKPRQIEDELKSEKMSVELSIYYRQKVGDSDTGYVAYIIKYEDYNFCDIVYDLTEYSNTPFNITSDYRENKQKYINEKRNILLKNIKLYSFIDIRNEIDEIFKKSLTEYFWFDYKIIEEDLKKLLIKIENGDVSKHNILLLDEELDNKYLDLFTKNLLYRNNKETWISQRKKLIS